MLRKQQGVPLLFLFPPFLSVCGDGAFELSNRHPIERCATRENHPKCATTLLECPSENAVIDVPGEAGGGRTWGAPICNPQVAHNFVYIP